MTQETCPPTAEEEHVILSTIISLVVTSRVAVEACHEPIAGDDPRGDDDADAQERAREVDNDELADVVPTSANELR